MTGQRAIFLDRDGVINVNRVDNVRSWEQFHFEKNTLNALARLSGTAFRLIVITNQSGIGRGQMPHAVVEDIHSRMIQEIQRAGGRIDRVYYCPHLPEDACTCRKPSPEMLYRGRDEFHLDLEYSYLVGDWIDDVHAARNSGVTPMLVRTGRGIPAMEEMQRLGIPLPRVFSDLDAVVSWILERELEHPAVSQIY